MRVREFMIYYSLAALCERLDELSGTVKGKGKCRTVFILLPDIESWNMVIKSLRGMCNGEVRLSELCTDERLPTPAYICARLKQCRGRVLLTPLGELIRRRIYPELMTVLVRKGMKSGMLFVPLMACAHEFHMQIEAEQKCEVLELSGDEQTCEVECYSAEQVRESCMTLKEYLSVLESDDVPTRTRVSMHLPAHLAGRGARVIASGYAALCARLYAFEFAADERALTDAQWHALSGALDTLLDGEDMNARDALARCAEMESDGMFSPGDPLRLGAWLSRLSGLHAGEYMRHVMNAEALYVSLESAVALEILGEFMPEHSRYESLSPESMTSHEWLNVRSERGDMLRRLGMDKLPDEYWQLLDKVAIRRKLLYSSLCTSDERAFCREYLLVTYHISPLQIGMRADIRRMYPELNDELK